MKKAAQTVTILLCVGLILGAGCGPAPQTNRVSEVRFQEKIRVFEADMRAQLQDLEMRLEMLQGRGLKLSDQAKEKWLESSDLFEKTQDAFRTQLETVSTQNQASWIDYRENLNKRWESVEAAFQELKKSAGKRE
ncbi:hypothetical protein K8S19_11635 [bacterium]|nr:hypothetical protein [bacterium]